MAAPSYVSSSIGGVTTNTISVLAPSSVVSGNLLLAVASCDASFFTGTVTTGASEFTVPSGWTQFGFTFSTVTTHHLPLAVYYKFASASEPGTYDFTCKNNYLSVAILQYSGVTSTSPLDVKAFAGHNTSSGDFPSVTTSVADERLVFGITTYTGVTTSSTVATLRAQAALSPDRSLAVLDKTQASAGSSGTVPFSLSSGCPYKMFTIGIKPPSSRGRPATFFPLFVSR